MNFYLLVNLQSRDTFEIVGGLVVVFQYWQKNFLFIFLIMYIVNQYFILLPNCEKKEKYVILIHRIQFFASGVPAKKETKGLENIEQKCNCGLKLTILK